MKVPINAAQAHQVLAQMAWERGATDLEQHVQIMADILRLPEHYRELWRRVEAQARPTIVCLCGSTRFWAEYVEWQRRETLAGKIVLTVGFFVHAPDGNHEGTAHMVSDEVKAQLDELHLRKIDLADEVLILNVGGYMGDSTRAELAYARARHKVIHVLEPLAKEDR